MNRFFTKDHEWVAIEGEIATVGISDYAQAQLGDITFVELPAPGTAFKAGDAVAVVDSVKAASDVYAPLGGSVTEVNPALADTPELVNTEAERGGWLFRLKLDGAADTSGLMDEAGYAAHVKAL
ncbi:MAG: glycine cleavage system protein GcvH [Sphingomonadales bacterium]|nr:glycine cleavage system protein GcvH [Sphingomonadales bacterium]